MSGSVLKCAGSYFRMLKVEQQNIKISTFFMVDHVFGCSAVLVVVVQDSLFQCETQVIDEDTWSEKEKALRVSRAVNIG